MTTWLWMVLAALSGMDLLDWDGTGIAKPLWAFALPSVLGLIGLVAALVIRQVGWAIVSPVWGLALVPLLIFVVTIISGP
ncbi:MAG: hypothetical protein Q4P15_11790 [Propionibacteriaceae bacterium]|nr:hypothetical protein [Propionibacteriaceae bacterium]